ncbi:MAG: dTMP kinase [Chloroflexota bacterium]
MAARLRRAGEDVLETHEPGGTRLGDELRRLLLLRADLKTAARSEALLMNASRAQLVEDIVRPALGAGTIVICDRFADSTLAYQGGGRGLSLAELDAVISFATAGLHPDMTILLDVPVEVGLARKHGSDGWNRFEAEAVAFHERVRSTYLNLAHSDPVRWKCFDAQRTPADLADDIWRTVATRLELAL